jgi:hypothetical protein
VLVFLSPQLFEMVFFSLALAWHGGAHSKVGSGVAGAAEGWIDTALSVLTLCKAVEKRTWHTRHPLAQLLGQPGVSPGVVAFLESQR